MKKNEIYDIRFINAFVLQFKTHNEVEHQFDGESLSGVKYGGNRLIWQKDLIFCKDKGWYQLNNITIAGTYDEHTLYTAIVMERSDTAMLILPFNGSSRKELCWTEYLVNAFSFREDHDDNDRIWVLMRVPSQNDRRFIEVCNILRECDEFISEEIIGTEYQMFTLLIPEEFRNDADLILQSRFSKITEGAKRRILAFHNIQDDNNKIKLQLYKSPILKNELEKRLSVKIHSNAELRSSIDMERETFYNKYILDDSRYSLTVSM